MFGRLLNRGSIYFRKTFFMFGICLVGFRCRVLVGVRVFRIFMVVGVRAREVLWVLRLFCRCVGV